MLKIGLTGGIGSGKTTASNLFSELGIMNIEADHMTHNLLMNGSIIYKDVLSAFGNSILNSHTNEINRAKLAELVFNDKKELQRLLSIIYPALREEFKKKATEETQKGTATLIFVGSQILEAGWEKAFDIIILVTAAFDLRIKRLLNTKRFTRPQIFARAAFQWPDWIKMQYSDFIIDNNSTLMRLKEQVIGINEELNLTNS